MKKYWAILVAFLTVGCGLENDNPVPHYVEIEAELVRIIIEGYDGFFITDWVITNTSDVAIDGWEIFVDVTTPNTHTKKGVFFRHDISMQEGITDTFYNNILFYRDSENIYPIALSASDTTLRSWTILSQRGIIYQ